MNQICQHQNMLYTVSPYLMHLPILSVIFSSPDTTAPVLAPLRKASFTPLSSPVPYRTSLMAFPAPLKRLSQRSARPLLIPCSRALPRKSDAHTYYVLVELRGLSKKSTHLSCNSIPSLITSQVALLIILHLGSSPPYPSSNSMIR